MSTVEIGSTAFDVRPIEILLVEDSPTDVLLAQEALEHAKVLNNLHIVNDGVEAMQFLVSRHARSLRWRSAHGRRIRTGTRHGERHSDAALEAPSKRFDV